MRFSYGHKTERIVERGAGQFFKQKQNRATENCGKLLWIRTPFEIVFFVCLRVIGHFPFGTGEIVALDVFNVDVVVFVFQFAGIGGSVLVALAAALELVRL